MTSWETVLREVPIADLVGAMHEPPWVILLGPREQDALAILFNQDVIKPADEASGGGLHEMGKGSVRAAIASKGYLPDDEFRLHDMHVHDQVFITKNDEHVEEISMKQ